MARRATAGDFLQAASDQLHLARAAPESSGSTAGVADIARSLGQVVAVLARYLADIDAAGDILFRVPLLDGWPRAAVEARESLSAGIRALGYSRIRRARPVRQGPNDAAASLVSAATSLTAARDLLQTHFAPDRTYASEWAPVISSPQVTRALAAETSWWARQMAPLAMSLAQTAVPRSARSEDVRYRLQVAGRSLWDAAGIIDTALLRDPATAADLAVLRAIPVNSMPARVVPQGTEPVTLLCEGTISTAERVRQVTRKPDPAWSPDISETSLRHTAGMAVVISHNCGVALDLLAPRATHLGLTEVGAGLAESAAAAYAAQARWLDAARAWGNPVMTDTRGTRSPVCREAEDLAVWTGRLVYRDPQWTPAHGRRHDLRPPGELAEHAGDLSRAVAAVHNVGEALNRLAEAEHEKVRAIANAGRLYVRTRSLPDWFDIPRAYGRAPRERVNALLATYQAVERANTCLATALAEIADLVRAPSGILGVVHATAGRSVQPAGHGPARSLSSAAPALSRSSGAAERQPGETGVLHPDFPAALHDLLQMPWDELQTRHETAHDERNFVGRDRIVTQALAFERCHLDPRRAHSSGLADRSAAHDGRGLDTGPAIEAIWLEPQAE